MSRSKKDAVGGHQPKKPGYEYWGRRSQTNGAQPGWYTKLLTHRIERRRNKRLCRQATDEIETQ